MIRYGSLIYLSCACVLDDCFSVRHFDHSTVPGGGDHLTSVADFWIAGTTGGPPELQVGTIENVDSELKVRSVTRNKPLVLPIPSSLHVVGSVCQ